MRTVLSHYVCRIGYLLAWQNYNVLNRLSLARVNARLICVEIVKPNIHGWKSFECANIHIVRQDKADQKGSAMSKQNIKSELADYLNASTATDAGEWSIDAMAEELDNMGYNSIDDMDEHEFTCFLMDWDGMVVNNYGDMVEAVKN